MPTSRAGTHLLPIPTHNRSRKWRRKLPLSLTCSDRPTFSLLPSPPSRPFPRAGMTITNRIPLRISFSVLPNRPACRSEWPATIPFGNRQALCLWRLSVGTRCLRSKNIFVTPRERAVVALQRGWFSSRFLRIDMIIVEASRSMR